MAPAPSPQELRTTVAPMLGTLAHHRVAVIIRNQLMDMFVEDLAMIERGPESRNDRATAIFRRQFDLGDYGSPLTVFGKVVLFEEPVSS